LIPLGYEDDDAYTLAVANKLSLEDSMVEARTVAEGASSWLRVVAYNLHYLSYFLENRRIEIYLPNTCKRRLGEQKHVENRQARRFADQNIAERNNKPVCAFTIGCLE